MKYVLLILLFIPAVALAAPGDFVPLVNIPGLDFSDATLGQYVNSVFALVISVAVMLAVLRVAIGGFRYMTEEAVSTKGEARKIIQDAVLGLILVLAAWLILTTINPNIVKLEVLKFDSLHTNITPLASTQSNVEIGNQIQEFGNQNQDNRESVVDAARAAAGFMCEAPGSLGCDLFYPTRIVYASDQVHVHVQNLNYGVCENEGNCGEFITKNVSYRNVLVELCSQNSSSSIPGCQQ